MFWSTVALWGLVCFRGVEFPELAFCLRQWQYGRSARVVLVSAVCARGNRKILMQAVLSYLSCTTKGGLWTHQQAMVWSNPAHNGRTQSWLLWAGLAEFTMTRNSARNTCFQSKRHWPGRLSCQKWSWIEAMTDIWYLVYLGGTST